MSERDNALSQGVMVKYTEAERDQLEQELAEVSNKCEINRRSANGITVVAYWHRSEDIVTLFVHDTRTNGSVEFIVPNDEVMSWFDHPFANPNAVMPIYEQSENDGS